MSYTIVDSLGIYIRSFHSIRCTADHIRKNTYVDTYLVISSFLDVICSFII